MTTPEAQPRMTAVVCHGPEDYRVEQVAKPHAGANELVIRIAHESAASIAKELIRREFVIDYRPGAGVRISPHFYTTDNELELVVEEMKKIRDSRAFEVHETAGAAF